jgi:hypothetical protein
MLVSTCLCIIFLNLNAITHDMPQNPALSAGLIHMINNMNIVISFTAVGLISYYFRHASMTLEQQLETLANTDFLTGLYNRQDAGNARTAEIRVAAEQLGFHADFCRYPSFQKF